MGRAILFIIVTVFLVAPAAAGDAPPRTVAVTFDDLPSQRMRWDNDELGGMTAAILEHCRRAGVPAVGFVNESKLYVDGEPVAGRVDLLQAWRDAGFELGNHTYSHPDLHRIPLDEFKDDVVRGERITRGLMSDSGTTLRYFRHPLLHTGRDLETKHELERFLTDRGYVVAPVTVDNSEWIFGFAYYKAREAGDQELMRRLAGAYIDYMEAMVAYYEDQSRALFRREIPQVLLVHANWLNADHFGGVADMMARRGYRFVTLEEAMADAAYESPDTYTGSGGITWIHRWAITAGKGRDFFGDEPPTPQWVLAAAGMESY
jgi:peptidoglycan/xylan/chitin deacetylase (PgdA/CDA1 family)